MYWFFYATDAISWPGAVVCVCVSYLPGLQHAKGLTKAQLPDDVRGHEQPPLEDVHRAAGAHLLTHPAHRQVHFPRDNLLKARQRRIRDGHGEEAPMCGMEGRIGRGEDALRAGRRQRMVEVGLEEPAARLVDFLCGGDIADVDFFGGDADYGAFIRGH